MNRATPLQSATVVPYCEVPNLGASLISDLQMHAVLFTRSLIEEGVPIGNERPRLALVLVLIHAKIDSRHVRTAGSGCSRLPATRHGRVARCLHTQRLACSDAQLHSSS